MQDHLKDRNEKMKIILILLVFIYLFLWAQSLFSLISSIETLKGLLPLKT